MIKDGAILLVDPLQITHDDDDDYHDDNDDDYHDNDDDYHDHDHADDEDDGLPASR